MEELKEKFKWIKERLECGEIKVSLTHDSYAKTLFEEGSTEDKYDYLIDLFMMSLWVADKEGYPKDYVHYAFGNQCGECGEELSYSFNGSKLKDGMRSVEMMLFNHTECEKINEYSVEIEFPTGELICNDTLPYANGMFEALEKATPNINSRLGLKERTLAYANENILHVFVSNTSPSLFKKGETLVIGRSSDNECAPCSCGEEICDCEYEEYYPLEGSEPIASICTDLWWATLVDVAVYRNHLINYYGEEQGEKYLSQIKQKVKTKIKPGVYNCTCHRVEDYEDCPPMTYVTLEWLRDV